MPSSSAVLRPHRGAGRPLCAVASATLLLVAAGCAAPAPRPPVASVQAEGSPPAVRPLAPAADWSGPVPIARLVQAAQAAHPTMAAIAAAQAAAAAQVRQAGAWENPALELSVGRTRPRQEGVTRDRPYGGSLSQRLAWWGRRNARLAAARAQQGASEAEGRVALLALQADVRRAAIAYAAAVDAAEQAAVDARTADALAAMAAARLAAGDAGRAEAARAALEAATAAVQRETRRREAATALALLRTWCDPALPDGLVIADAEALPALDAAALAQTAGRHPQLQALAQAAAAAEAELAAERQARIPEPTLGVYAEREDDQDTYGLTLGFAIPLWDGNEGGIAAAAAARAQAQAAARGERLRLQRDLAEALAAVQGAQAEAAALAAQAVPAAEEAVRLHAIAVEAGAAGFADLLEARRAAQAVQAALRDARRRAALAAVDLGVAVGDPRLGAESP